MPIYEFECPVCEKKIEEITIYSKAKKPRPCIDPECIGMMKMIVSAVNFITDETRAKRIFGKGRPAKGQSRGKFKK
jgi:putative FmdB family regulatory protein